MKDKINVIRKSLRDKQEKTTDLDILVAQIMQLPYGQMKKVLTPQVLEILHKYGYGEET